MAAPTHWKANELHMFPVHPSLSVAHSKRFTMRTVPITFSWGKRLGQQFARTQEFYRFNTRVKIFKIKKMFIHKYSKLSLGEFPNLVRIITQGSQTPYKHNWKHLLDIKTKTLVKRLLPATHVPNCSCHVLHQGFCQSNQICKKSKARDVNKLASSWKRLIKSDLMNKWVSTSLEVSQTW